MSYQFVSSDSHIDLTYCPPDLWSSQAPAKWKLLAPRVEELEDGLHWFIDGKDVGMWNGVGPGFGRYEKGRLNRVDKMYDLGFYTGHHLEAEPRPTTPQLRLKDLDTDGIDAELIYGILGANLKIQDGEMAGWVFQTYNDWAVDFANRGDPHRLFPLAAIPYHDPSVAAAEVRRCAVMSLRGGDLPVKKLAYPLWHHAWYPVWEAAAECQFPISFHSTGFTGARVADNEQMADEYYLEVMGLRSVLFQVDGAEVLAGIILSGACEKFPGFRFVLGESGVTWLPYILDRFDVEYEDRLQKLNFSLKPSDYFRRNGMTTYQQEQSIADIVHLVGEDNIMWATDYPHPDCLFPESHRIIEEQLGRLPERTKQKIVCDNVVKLYHLD
jgi:predicted TIM-barrel fold metal-dependent hydrolase